MFPHRNPFAEDPPERQPTDPEQVEPQTVGDAIDDVLRDPVARHRAASLAAAGLNARQARALALDKRVDKDFVIERLLKRGCPPDIAFDIAAF